MQFSAESILVWQSDLHISSPLEMFNATIIVLSKKHNSQMQIKQKYSNTILSARQRDNRPLFWPMTSEIINSGVCLVISLGSGSLCINKHVCR